MKAKALRRRVSSTGARLAALGLTALAMTQSARAVAGEEEPAADALFTEGKRLLAQRDYARACPKLADSFSLDPATGTLLALAICHERQGRLASASAEYGEVVARSRRESRPDRGKAAEQRIAAIWPLMSTLTITSENQIKIKRDGVPLDPNLTKKAVPVDGGTHVIEASAPGKKAWHKRVTVASREDRQTVIIPDLEDAPAEEIASPPDASEPSNAGTAAKATASKPAATGDLASELRPVRVVGITTLVAGAVGLSVGTFFAYRAVVKNGDSNSGCTGNLCSAQATQDRLDARSFGNLATVGFVAGGALVVAGLATYLAGRSSPAPSTSATVHRVEALPMIGVQAWGGVVRGSF